MGMRFRKSINLGGGTKLNISKSGVGVSTGVKGFRKSVNTSGRTRTTVSVPGTGISYVKESNTSGKNNANGGCLLYVISEVGIKHTRALIVR